MNDFLGFLDVFCALRKDLQGELKAFYAFKRGLEITIQSKDSILFGIGVANQVISIDFHGLFFWLQIVFFFILLLIKILFDVFILLFFILLRLRLLILLGLSFLLLF